MKYMKTKIKVYVNLHGRQISNLNVQELLIHFIVVLSLLFNRSIKPICAS